MPRIQQYETEQAAASPREAIAPNLEAIGAAGQGLSAFGRDIAESSEKIRERQAQMEQSSAFGDVSEQKVNDLQDMQQQTQDGTWDVDKYKNKFFDWQQDQLDNYETQEGKNTFLRQSNRMLGSMLTQGMKAQKLVAANNANAQYQDNVDNLATATRFAPDTYEDNKAAMYEHIMDLPAAARPAAELHGRQLLASERVKGIADTDPDAADKLLQDKDFVKDLKPQEYDSLKGMVDRAKEFQAKEPERAAALAQKEQAAIKTKYLSDNTDAIIKGSISPQKVLTQAPSSMDLKTRVDVASTIQRAQSLMQKTSPTVLADTYNRLLLPKDDPRAITDISQLYAEPGLAPQDIGKLKRFYIDTPMGEAQKQQESNVLKVIQSRLKVQGIPDPDYQMRVVNAMSDYHAAKDKLVKDGKDPSVLMDPKSKEYFPMQVQPTSAIDIMNAQAARITGQKTGSNDIVYTAPGIIPNAAKTNETELKLQNGKTAVYDSKTKKFLRYK